MKDKSSPYPGPLSSTYNRTFPSKISEPSRIKPVEQNLVVDANGAQKEGVRENHSYGPTSRERDLFSNLRQVEHNLLQSETVDSNYQV